MYQKTRYYSWKLNELADGCKQCVLGRKLVVFVTGICPKNCFYCPLSEQKKNKDVIYANERQLSDENDIDALIDEASKSISWGAGFTGGDPLMRIERTCRFIKVLKERFGEKFHIHLYTILETINDEKLKKLEDAGLDELRLHPDIFNDRHWNNINMIFRGKKKKYDFNVDVEIPSLPGYEMETKRLIDYFINKIDFLNINELEISDTNSQEFTGREFHTKDRTSYAVKGSEELGLKLLGYIGKKYPRANVHFCTCKLKDGVQLKERLKIRAENTKKVFDIVDDEGITMRGVIYLKELKPSFGYIRKLKGLSDYDKAKMIDKLKIILSKMVKEYGIPANLIEIDENKLRIISNIGIVKNLAKPLKASGLVPAIVEQYPTYDQMEVDVEFL